MNTHGKIMNSVKNHVFAVNGGKCYTLGIKQFIF